MLLPKSWLLLTPSTPQPTAFSWASSDMLTEATNVHSNAKTASFGRNKKQECIPETHFGGGCVLNTSLSLLFFGLCMLQWLLPRDSLWYLKDKLTLWDWAIVGVSALVWSSTKHQLMSADFSSTIKATTASDSSPRSHLCTAYFCSCIHALGAIPLLQHSSPQAATWSSSPECSASCLPSTAEPSYLQKHLANGD